MSNPTDPTKRVSLYSDMVIEARRLGDYQLLLMAQKRLHETKLNLGLQAAGTEVIPFPGFNRHDTFQVQKPRHIWPIFLQTAMIPAGMALVLFAFIQATIHIYRGPWN